MGMRKWISRGTGALLSAAIFGGVMVGGPTAALAESDERAELPASVRAPGIPLSLLPTILPGHAAALAIGPGEHCDKDIDETSEIRDTEVTATQDIGICSSSDIDVYTFGVDTFVVQAGGPAAAWIITDVSDPAAPILLHTEGLAGPNLYRTNIRCERDDARCQGV